MRWCVEAAKGREMTLSERHLLEKRIRREGVVKGGVTDLNGSSIFVS